MNAMTVFFTLVTGVGMLFLVVVPIGATVLFSDALQGRVLGRTPVRTIADLLAGKAHPRRVAVRATSVGDLVHSGLSGTPCLWYRVTLYRVDKVSTESGFDWHHVPLRSEASADTVFFTDGTGTVPVDVRLLAKPAFGEGPGLVETRPPVRTDHPDRTRRTDRFELVEELVLPDVPATLFARPAYRGGEFVLAWGRGYRTGVTGLTRDEVVDRFAGEVRDSALGIRSMLIIAAVALACGLSGLWITK